MNKLKLTVVSSTATKNDNYVNKLVGQGTMIETDLGQAESAKPTYYMFTKSGNEVGKESELNMDLFDIVKKDFDFTDDAGQPRTATLSYLYPKRP